MIILSTGWSYLRPSSSPPELKTNPVKDVLDRRLSCFLFMKHFTPKSRKCHFAYFGALGSVVCLC